MSASRRVVEEIIARGDTVYGVNTGFGKNVAILMGSNFADDKGNATFYATFDQKAAVLEAKYDYSACVLDAIKSGALKCGGSGTAAANGAGGYFTAYVDGVRAGAEAPATEPRSYFAGTIRN